MLDADGASFLSQRRRAWRPAGGRRWISTSANLQGRAAGDNDFRARAAVAGQNLLPMPARLAHKTVPPRGPGGDRRSDGRFLQELAAQRSPMIKLIRLLFVCTVILAIAGCGFVGLTLWYFGRDLPDYQQLAHYEPPITTRVYAEDGRLLAEYANERRIFVPVEAIPPLVKKAFIAAEDKNFYIEHGVDPVSILRAALTDIGRLGAHRRPIGASTITQQVAKNMLLSNELSVARKVKEILLATRIDDALPKDRILELYLNEIYLGDSAYGIAAAAQSYFDKSLDQLSLGEA
ncbi:MAG TPA: transglycosylase domain-containing protein, partial [Stellaceae bacterium]|nr:transglycosylase domain-containing protein [Stellaceae bacterium]